jgi:signal transduction histidine kinase
MDIRSRSLRQKIIVGYLSGVVLVLAFILLSWNNLSTLQEQITSGDAVSSLFDTTLEIRRFEKNFFLYRTDDDYRELISYIDQADELLDRQELYLFTTPEVVGQLKRELSEYNRLLQSEATVTGPQEQGTLEGQIREKGKEIVTTTEGIAADRSSLEADALQSAKQQLVSGVALILLAGMAGGLFLYSKAMRPLQMLEKHMNRIAEGEFSLIETRFTDRELISLRTAFNRMLIELRERQKYLVQSEKLASLGTLVFGVAHELNNPLSNISTASQILSEEVESEDIAFKRELLSQIEAETDRARDVVASILEFSRSKERGTFPLKKAVQETLRFIKAEIPPRVTVQLDIPDDLKLYADRQKIQQMILNLLKNAIDAISGEGRIDIYASYVGEHGENVGIAVRDNGAGMDQEKISQIFDPFFTSKKKGHGLGLFIVHNIVKEHDGSISVESRPGKGTAFTIVVPARERKAQADETGSGSDAD